MTLPIDRIASVNRDATAGQMNFGLMKSRGNALSVVAGGQQQQQQPQVQAAQKTTLEDVKNNYEDFKKRVDKLNSMLDSPYMRLSFGMEGNTFFMKVVNMESGKVVKQIPPQEMIDFLERLEQDVSKNTAIYSNKAGQ